jgi:serine/threonine protein kinase
MGGIIGEPVSNIHLHNVDDFEKIYRNIRPALEHVHKIGVIHLDVSPNNNIYGDNGKGEFIAQLIDWGSAARTGCKFPVFVVHFHDLSPS